MKKFKYETIIFIIEAICMILELVASRVLSPYFGNTNIVWTSVIGIILLSSSLGNYFGGRIADKKDNEKSLKIITMITSIFILAIPIVQEGFLKSVSAVVTDDKIGAIVSTIVLFFIPSLLMGLITPIILKLKLTSLEDTGRTAGKIYAISTIGGIFGTFLGGFFLIPNFGSVEILFVLSIVLLILSIFIHMKFDKITIAYIIFVLLIDSILFTFYYKINIDKAQKVLDGDMSAVASFDTQYGRVLIYNTYYGGEPIRMLNIDSGYESATFIDENKRNDLVFTYTKYYDLMFKSNKSIKDVLLIGGAGYSYPKYFISNYDDKNMDVVEIDGDITRIARKYFYLDRLIEDYKLDENHRLNLINEDGRTYLNTNKKKYDVILNDAFSGEVPAKTLTTLETVNKIKSSLNNDGLYLTNIISSLEGNDSRFLRAEVNTLKKAFRNVYIVPCREKIEPEKKQNVMVIATDQEIEFEKQYDLKLSEDEIILTDNYCPVDTLIE